MSEPANINPFSTLRTSRAKYRRLSPAFLDEIKGLIDNRNSVSILGARGVGKQHAVEEVTRRLQASGHDVIYVRCDNIDPITAEHALCRTFNQLLGVPATDSIQMRLRHLEDKLETDSRYITLIVSDADQLPHAVTRQLLIGLRRLTQNRYFQKGSFAVILTGSLELSPLQHGVDSEFHPDVHFVLQGYAPETFREVIRTAIPSEFEVDEEAIQQLTDVTGGNVVVLHQFVFFLKDLQRRNPNRPCQLNRRIVADIVQELSHSGVVHSHVHLSAFTRIENSRSAIRQLEDLIASGGCVPEPNSSQGDALENPPTELELSGIAIRTGQSLSWQSPFMEKLARQYFSWWTIGDAYACCDLWDDALRCYRSARTMGHPWIQNPIQRPRLNAALRAFETHLHRLAGEPDRPVSMVLQFFQESSTFVLGFDEVYKYERSSNGGTWNPAVERSPDPSIYLPALSSCSDDQRLTEFSRSAPQTDRPFVRLIHLSCKETGHHVVLLCSCLQSRSPITHARHTQMGPVVSTLQQAFERACQHEHSQSQSRLQEQLLAALPRVFQIVSPRVTNVTMEALREAGEKLRSQGYRRVMFSLVDRHASEIRGVLDCREAGEPDVAAATRFPLPKGNDASFVITDVQQQCVVNRQSIRLDDAQNDPRSYEPSVQAGIKAILLVPLISHIRGNVLGTMHVERVDKKPLSDAELKSFEYFAKQLAEAIQATIMLDLLEGSVQDQPDAMVLLDADGAIAFVNSKAARLLGEHAGWCSQGNAPVKNVNEVFNPQISEVIQKADQLRKPYSGYINFGKANENKLHVVTAQPLQDWRDVQVGMLVQISDIRGVSQLWREIRELGTAIDLKSLNETVLRIFQERGHSWCRIYLMDGSRELLKGAAQFGFDDTTESGLLGRQAFTMGTAVLRGPSESPTSWISLKRSTPIIFEAVVNNSPLAGTEPSNSALPVVYATEDHFVPGYSRKSPGDRWIDLPLTQKLDIATSEGRGSIRGEKTQYLGTISINCPPDLTLEQLEQLRILAEALSSSYAAMIERGRRQRLDEEKTRAAMEKAIGETCHRLQSSILAMEVVMQLVEDACDSELRRRWGQGRTHLQNILADATNRLRAFKIEYGRICLEEFLRNFLAATFDSGQYNLQVTDKDGNRQLLADIDASRFQEALEELVTNSRKATRHATVPLSIDMTVEVVPEACSAVERIRIVYRDNGKGIADDCRTRIFEEWYSHWDDAASCGSGMGMSHVRRILRAHSGDISCEASDTGACFVLTFPRWADPESNTISVDGINEVAL
ncbi:MAG: ATP-binding protein [Planctomyces sp.]